MKGIGLMTGVEITTVAGIEVIEIEMIGTGPKTVQEKRSVTRIKAKITVRKMINVNENRNRLTRSNRDSIELKTVMTSTNEIK
jgi:hypothetical protein